MRYGVGLATALVVLLSVAELLIRSTLARPLNPLLDLHLAAALARLLTGTLGGAPGWLALAGLAALPVVAGAWSASRPCASCSACSGNAAGA